MKILSTVFMYLVVTMFFFAVATMCAMFIAANIAQAADVNLTLAWDADTQDAEKLDWEELRVYQRLDGEAYDYTTPLSVVPQSYEAGNSMPTNWTINTTYPDSDDPVSEATRFFTIRSAAQKDGAFIESEDSNEASHTINNARPAKITDMAAVYNPQTDSIDFTWTTVPDERVTSYQIQISDNADTGFTTVAEMPADAVSASLASADIYPAGAITTKYWEVKSVTELNIHSRWGNIVEVTVDRQVIIDPVRSFRLILE